MESTQIVVALIGFLGTIITVLVNGSKTRDEISVKYSVQENEIKHINEKIVEMSADIKEHNGYAKVIPAMQEHIKNIDEKISDIKKEQK